MKIIVNKLIYVSPVLLLGLLLVNSCFVYGEHVAFKNTVKGVAAAENSLQQKQQEVAILQRDDLHISDNKASALLFSGLSQSLVREEINSSALEIENIQEQFAAPQKNMRHQQYRLFLLGGYKNLYRLLYMFLRWQRYVMVSDLKVVPKHHAGLAIEMVLDGYHFGKSS
ncbi:MAG: hypothetical protein KAS93_00105 [Gammaproteobacteria bacterium]|nr:hypothetical protein [Gammaproteobacteria bacterium]